jgi:hypothetical protein
MLRKLSALVGFGAGYVLGTRAGREQYEKIMQMLQGVKENPRVQETTSMLSQQATELADTASSTVQDKVSTATDKAKSAVSSSDSVDLTAGPMAGAAPSGSAPTTVTPGAATRSRS